MMQTLRYQLFYRRRLPHWQPPGATFFITFRLRGSLPRQVLEQLVEERASAEKRLRQIQDLTVRTIETYREERRLFGKWDQALHTAREGPRWLEDPRIASLVAESLQYWNGKTYDLLAFCVMPNHVHLVCTPLEEADGEYFPLSAILHSLKGYTARRANQILSRTGPFWQRESYDHVVRNERELIRIIQYVQNNPVAAGLVQNWQEWPWTYPKDSP
ncbi:MAG: transposase [Anaerolineae bacterium]|nr:transposase [Anaerolineae bacterium]